MSPASASVPRESHPDASPSSPLPKASQFSSSPYVPYASQAAATALEPRTKESVNKRVQVWTPQETVQAYNSPSSYPDRIPVAEKCCREFSSWHWCSGWGAHCGAGTPWSSGGNSAAYLSLQILNCKTMSVGPACFTSLPQSVWLLVYIFSYRISVQLICRWFSMMAVL